MQIASWNINGVKARLETAVRWLQEAEPDVCCLQEIKSVDEGFPRERFEDLGYNVETHGQKGFNGVAILSKRPPEEVNRRLPGDDDDEQARYIEALIPGTAGLARVASIYLPNGNPIDSPKYPYKLAWMDRLIGHARQHLRNEEILILAGDYNVIPAAIDASKPKAWENDALFLPQTRQKFRELTNLGLTEALRATSAAPDTYTFWDYQAGAWQRNNGIRIDHHLLSPQAADRLTACRIDKHVRGWEKPSDHVPIIIELDV